MNGKKNTAPNPGETFGNLTFIKEGDRKLYGKKQVSLRTADVRCKCGKEYNILLKNLQTVKGCGCDRRIYDRLDSEEVMRLYAIHNSAYVVADILNLNNCNAVRRILKDNNIPLSTRKYNIDQDYFESVDNEEKAYWLGFLAADGTIRLRHGGHEKKRRGSSIILKLAVKDEDHVKRFSDIFGGNSRITYHRDYTSNKGKESYSDNCRVSINSNKLVEDIINKGVIPRKTEVLEYPNIDEKYYNHYLRGYFDGNGTVGFGLKEAKSSTRAYVVKTISLGISSFSMGFKLWLIEYLKKNDIEFKLSGKYDVTCTNMKEKYKFLDLIYKDSTIYLDRKYLIAKEFMTYYEEVRDSIDSKFYV